MALKDFQTFIEDMFREIPTQVKYLFSEPKMKQEKKDKYKTSDHWPALFLKGS